MADPCFKCDTELAPDSRFCHRCGAPTFAVGKTRKQAQPATAEERAEIKEVVLSAAQNPTATKMVQTVLVPTLPRPRPVPARPPLWFRILSARIWRRPLLWIAIAVLASVPTVLALVDDLQEKAQQQVGVQKIVTRLSARCFRESRAQIEASIARIQAASGGSDSLLDSAALLDLVVRGMRLPQGDCSHIVQALSRADRFEYLFRQPVPR